MATFTNNYYFKAEKLYATRRRRRDYKRISKNQVIEYDEARKCYIHRHHRTATVEIYLDKFVIDTGGWDTNTTWKKIGDWSPIRAGSKRISSWVGSKYVYWGNFTHATEYYDGIEVDPDGVPLDPKPIKVRRLRKGVTAPYLELRDRVFRALGPRAAIGEFDRVTHRQVDGMHLLNLVTDVAEWMNDHPSQAFVPDELNWRALFAQRDLMSFGNPIRWRQRPEPRTSLQRLRSNLDAAGKVYISQLKDGAYEIIEKDCNYWRKS